MDTVQRKQWREQRRAYVQKRRDASPRRLCECGCGTEIPSLTAALQPQRYVIGHQPPWTGQRKERVNQWESRARARRIKGSGPCELEHITGCGGRIEVHHVDGDYNNNDIANLMRLCDCHHGLVENGRIDLADPVMPRYRVSGGKRRYEHTYRYVARAVAREGSAVLSEESGAKK